jgi:L-ascorbate metabolism protein UlaG (beta-lactamase superfamily)
MSGEWLGMVAAASTAGVAAVGAGCGWLTPAVGWQRATGWHRIPGAPSPRRQLLVSSAGPAGGGDPDVAELDWLGHAGFRLRWRGVTLLVDPNLSPWCTVARRRLAPLPSPSLVGPAAATLLTHGHRDHLDLPTLAALPDPGVVVVPPGGEPWLVGLAARRRRRALAGAPREGSGAAAGSASSLFELATLAPGAALRVGALEVHAVEARHGGSRSHPFRAGAGPQAVGYVVRPVFGGAFPRSAIFFAGDTAWGPHFAAIARQVAPTVAVLPIGAFAPRWPLRHYHLSPEEAVVAARTLGAETVVPCHFGTFMLSLDRPATALPRFARAAARAGLAWTMPRLLTAGDEAETNEAPARPQAVPARAPGRSQEIDRFSALGRPRIDDGRGPGRSTKQGLA